MKQKAISWISWLLVGGPANGKIVRILRGDPVVIPIGLKQYQYEPEDFVINGSVYRIGLNGPAPVISEIEKMIVDSGLKPYRAI
jgi:uncharacterized protein YjlB